MFRDQSSKCSSDLRFPPHAPRLPVIFGEPNPYTALNGGLLFTSGGQPWFSDGTGPNTRRLADIHASPVYGIFQGRAYFVGNDGVTLEAWSTDGTPGGTKPVSSFGVADLAGTVVYQYFASGNRLCAVLDSIDFGEELYRIF